MFDPGPDVGIQVLLRCGLYALRLALLEVLCKLCIPVYSGRLDKIAEDLDPTKDSL
jgi:hypothetical protein